MTHALLRILAGSAVGLFAALTPQDASPAEFRRELEQLRAENDALRRQNEVLLARVADLERRLGEALAAQPPATGASPPPPPPPGPPAGVPDRPAETPTDTLPDDPLAAPDAMLAHLRRAYREAFGHLPRTTARQRQEYAERVRRWITDVSNEARGTPTWLVRLSRPQQVAGRRFEAMMVVLDRRTLAPIGQPFLVDVPAGVVDRLNDARFDAWDLTVLFAAAPTFDPERAEPGPLDHPRFVGPYAEFGYALDWRGLEGVSLSELRSGG